MYCHGTRGIVNRQIGVKNFIRVVILDPRTKGHVIQHAQPQNCHGPLCTAKRPTYDIASISETITPINMKFQDNNWTTKMCPTMQYCDVITNPRWRTAAILKIAKSQYFSEKSSDFDKIWYTKDDIEPDDSHVTKN